jgi:DNA-binding XRE family transcriptional regulator
LPSEADIRQRGWHVGSVNKLLDLRLAAGMTQAQLAAQLKISRQA